MAKKAKKTKAESAPEGWQGKLQRAWQWSSQALEHAAAKLPWKRPGLWLSGFFHPDEACGRECTLAELFGNLLIFYFAYSAVFFAAMVAVTSLAPQPDAEAMGFQRPNDLLWSGLSLLVANTIVSALGALVAFAFVYLAAKALGGKGSYVGQSYPMSLVLCGENALLLVSAAAGLALLMLTYAFRGVAVVEMAAALFALLVGVPLILACVAIVLYSIYAQYRVVKKAHALPAWKAVCALAAGAALVVLANVALNLLMR